MTTVPVQPTSDAERPDELATFVRELDELSGDGSGNDAFAVAYGPPRPGGAEVLEYLEISNLLGWEAPGDVDRIAVIGGAHARLVDGCTQPVCMPGLGELAPGDARAVSMVVVGDRQGRLSGRLRIAGSAQEQTPTGGRLVDALRRCFRLPTAPPPCSTAGLLASLWLAAVAGAERRRGRHRGRLSWIDVLRLHPANALLTIELPDAPRPVLETVARRAPSVWTWEELRRASAHNGTLDELCPSELSAWMDDGMFARWALGSAATAAELTGLARDRVGNEAWDEDPTGLLEALDVDLGLSGT